MQVVCVQDFGTTVRGEVVEVPDGAEVSPLHFVPAGSPGAAELAAAFADELAAARAAEGPAGEDAKPAGAKPPAARPDTTPKPAAAAPPAADKTKEGA